MAQSIKHRKKTLSDAKSQHWDIIIIGGGITAAGIFRQASLDGYKTLLIEKEDFASGTSWCSSKLIHGGLRYLEQFNIKLVAESIREKNHLLAHAPDLVKPLPFLFPVYENDRRPLWMIHLGTWLYALLSKLRTKPKKFTAADLKISYPQLKKENLIGGILYQDAQTIDTSLTLSCILSGLEKHALALNHVCCQDILMEGDRVSGVLIKDEISHTSHQMFGSWIIDATGPWKELNYKKNVPMVYSKGSHLVLKHNPFKLSSAVTMFSPDDGRVMFCIPWLEHTLVGTTDAPTQDQPDHVAITQKEIEYMQRTLQHYFPDQPYKVVSHFSGLRTLIGTANRLSDIKRDHHIKIPKPGLLHVYGGKLTAFTKIALDVMHKIQSVDHAPKSKRHLKNFKTPHQPDINHLTMSDLKHFIEHEMAFTVSDILIRRTLANIRLEDHGQRYLKLVKEALQQHFGYDDVQIQQQIQDYNIQSQQFDIGES